MPHEDAESLMAVWEEMRKAKRTTHQSYGQFRSLMDELKGMGLLSHAMPQVRPEKGAYVVTDWLRRPVLGSIYGELVFLDEGLASDCAAIYSHNYGQRVQVLHIIGVY